MLDNNNLDRSDQYFQILQLLRVVTRWIQESQKDLARMGKEWSWKPRFRGKHVVAAKEVLDTDEKIVRDNWRVLISHHTTLSEELFREIDRKTEDIKSLRDGASRLFPL